MKCGSERRVRLPKRASAERRASHRFALALEVRYTVSGRGAPMETGSGSTIDLSSSGLSFSADRPMLIGQKLHLSIDWPALLDGGVQLQLIMSGVVVRTDGTATAVQIRRHEFRTRRMGLPSKRSPDDSDIVGSPIPPETSS
jgi:hypothetical protein